MFKSQQNSHMKYFKFLFFLFISFLACTSSDNDETEQLSTEKLLKKYSKEVGGQIVNAVEFVYNEENLVEVTFPLSGKLIYAYENNLLVLEEKFDYNSSSQQYDVLDESTTFQYEDGVLISDLAVYGVEPDEHNKHKYTLGSNGKILQYDYYGSGDISSFLPSGGSRLFTFNQSNVVSESQTNGDEDEMFRIERTFDDKNNPILNSSIQSKRQIWALFLSPMSDNNMITRNSYDENNTLYSSLAYTYEYDEDGYPIKREELNNSTNELEEIILFEYY